MKEFKPVASETARDEQMFTTSTSATSVGSWCGLIYVTDQVSLSAIL